MVIGFVWGFWEAERLGGKEGVVRPNSILWARFPQAMFNIRLSRT